MWIWFIVALSIANQLFVFARSFILWEPIEFNPRRWSEGCRAAFVFFELALLVVLIMVGVIIEGEMSNA